MDTSEKGQHKLLYEGLNQHGFLFQERCAQILEQEWKTTGWRLEAKEYPVSSSERFSRFFEIWFFNRLTESAVTVTAATGRESFLSSANAVKTKKKNRRIKK